MAAQPGPPPSAGRGGKAVQGTTTWNSTRATRRIESRYQRRVHPSSVCSVEPLDRRDPRLRTPAACAADADDVRYPGAAGEPARAAAENDNRGLDGSSTRGSDARRRCASTAGSRGSSLPGPRRRRSPRRLRARGRLPPRPRPSGGLHAARAVASCCHGRRRRRRRRTTPSPRGSARARVGRGAVGGRSSWPAGWSRAGAGVGRRGRGERSRGAARALGVEDSRVHLVAARAVLVAGTCVLPFQPWGSAAGLGRRDRLAHPHAGGAGRPAGCSAARGGRPCCLSRDSGPLDDAVERPRRATRLDDEGAAHRSWQTVARRTASSRVDVA